MLSEVDRTRQWAQLVDALSDQLGVKIELDLDVKQFTGPDGAKMAQMVPVMRVVAVKDWPSSESSPSHSGDIRPHSGTSQPLSPNGEVEEDQTPPQPSPNSGREHESPTDEGEQAGLKPDADDHWEKIKDREWARLKEKQQSPHPLPPSPTRGEGETVEGA